MTKFKSKVMSLALAAALAVTSVFGGNFNAKAETTATQTTSKQITVHLLSPASWGSTTPSIYSYSRNSGDPVGSGYSSDDTVAFPGAKMNKETTPSGKNWYTYTYTPKKDNAFIVFSANGNQYPVANNQKGVDNAFKITTGGDYYFTPGSNTLNQSTTAPTSYTQPSDSQTAEDGYTVYFKKSSSWSAGITPKAYAYSMSGSKLLDGQSMTKISANWYKVVLPISSGKYYFRVEANQGSEYHSYPSSMDTDPSLKVNVNGSEMYAYTLNGTAWLEKPSVSGQPLVPSYTATASYNSEVGSDVPVTNTYRIHVQKFTTWTEAEAAQATAHVVDKNGNDIKSLPLLKDLANDGWFVIDLPLTAAGQPVYFYVTAGSHRYPDLNETQFSVGSITAFKISGESWVFRASGSTDVKAEPSSPVSGFKPSVPEGSETPAPTTVPTATPVVTVSPTAVPTAVPTVEPTAEPTVEPTVEPTAEPTVAPTVAPTEVPTVAPTMVPISNDEAKPEPTAVTQYVYVSAAPVANAPVASAPTAAALSATIGFDKEGKSAGETVKINVALANPTAGATYTYSYSVNGKTLATDTSATTVNWVTNKMGEYPVTVVVKENGVAVTTATANYTVAKRIITIKSIKGSLVKKGKKKVYNVKATAKTTAGKAKYKIVLAKKSGKKVATKKYSAKNTLVWKAPKKGTYKVTVYVKNGKGVEVFKTKTLKIKKVK